MTDWKTLEQDCKTCQRCGLCENRHHVVFGVGNRNSPVLLVGEGPGEQEDLQGEPFVGKAGQLLDDMMELIDLDRSKVYIANMVKCRPPRNRDPLNMEIEACRPWLEGQLALLQPKIIICLGRIAAMNLIKPDFRITKEHGVWYDRHGCKIMAIYHPSALLRDESKRPETFVDLREIRRMIRELCPEVYEQEGAHV